MTFLFRRRIYIVLKSQKLLPLHPQTITPIKFFISFTYITFFVFCKHWHLRPNSFGIENFPIVGKIVQLNMFLSLLQFKNTVIKSEETLPLEKKVLFSFERSETQTNQIVIPFWGNLDFLWRKNMILTPFSQLVFDDTMSVSLRRWKYCNGNINSK